MSQAGLRSRWQLSEPAREAAASAQARTLASEMGVSPLVASLLLGRGIDSTAAAGAFFGPKLTDLHDPFLLGGAQQAAQRIAKAVKESQPIVVYGDYDVDGITASAILWHVLRLAGANVEIYVPHRIDEGYGLNTAAIERLCQDHPLLITVDCGITAIDPAAAAARAGVDLIITDHHAFDAGGLPQAHTIVHPGLPGAGYPFSGLSGAGVAFKLAWAIAREHCGSQQLPRAYRRLLMDLLAYAALGTIADIVPLRDENRAIAARGLAGLINSPFEGVQALIKASGLGGESIDSYHVGFVLGPRLNACGRMGHAAEAAELLTTATGARAAEIATLLSGQNDKRREIQKDVFEQAADQARERGADDPGCRAIVVGDERWHPGVLGIVASRLVETFARPAVVLSFRDGVAAGSARSVPGVSMHAALEHCRQDLDTYGGHTMAAGMRLALDRVDAFRERFTQYVGEQLAEGDLIATVDVDLACELDDLSVPVVEQIESFAPFGQSNPRPVLIAFGLIVDQEPKLVGAHGQHLRLSLRQGNRVMSAVGFGLGDLAEHLARGATIDAVFEPRLNAWRGRRSAELHLKDFRSTQPEPVIDVVVNPKIVSTGPARLVK